MFVVSLLFMDNNLTIFNKAVPRKLSWQIFTVDTFVYDFLCSHYKEKNDYVLSSIWPAMCSIITSFYQEFCWLIWKNSQVSFFHDNWLGKW